MRDYQKSRVYAWERLHVKPLDKNHLSFEKVKMMVDAVWLMEGLQNPPSVEVIDPRNKKSWATGSRLSIHIPEVGLPRWVVLHELAHSMTMTHDYDTGEALEDCDKHGPDFVGIYMKLLVNYLKLPLPLLMFTAKKSNVDFNIGAKVMFKD